MEDFRFHLNNGKIRDKFASIIMVASFCGNILGVFLFQDKILINFRKPVVGTIVACHLVNICNEAAVKLNSNDSHRCICLTICSIAIKKERKKAMGIAWAIFIFLISFEFRRNDEHFVKACAIYCHHLQWNDLHWKMNWRIHLLSKDRFHWKN